MPDVWGHDDYLWPLEYDPINPDYDEEETDDE